MRVALLANGGDIPAAAVRALSRVAEVAVVVRPERQGGLARRLRATARRLIRGASPPDPLAAVTAQLGIPERRTRGPFDATLAACLQDHAVDLTCVATFPWRLPTAVLTATRLGAINLHPSVLPRHRGSNPWFWTYHADDRETGVTVHQCDATLDTGPILAQRRWPLPRGYPLDRMHRDAADRGAEMLADVVARMANGDLTAAPQNESGATSAGRVPAGVPMAGADWPAERVWHFLAGLASHYREPLLCGGKPVPYTRVTGYEPVDPPAPPRTVELVRRDRSWRLWCRDGAVRIERDSA